MDIEKVIPRPLIVGPITVVAHHSGYPVKIDVIDPALRPQQICGSRGAVVDLPLNRKRLDVFERDGGLVAITIDDGVVTAIDPLSFGRSFDFEGMVLHFLPGGPLDRSLYAADGTDAGSLLPLTEFKTAVARLAALPVES